MSNSATTEAATECWVTESRGQNKYSTLYYSVLIKWEEDFCRHSKYLWFCFGQELVLLRGAQMTETHTIKGMTEAMEATFFPLSAEINIITSRRLEAAMLTCPEQHSRWHAPICSGILGPTALAGRYKVSALHSWIILFLKWEQYIMHA